MEDNDQNIHLKNLSTHTAKNEEEALNLLFLGDTNRMIAEVRVVLCFVIEDSGTLQILHIRNCRQTENSPAPKNSQFVFHFYKCF